MQATEFEKSPYMSICMTNKIWVDDNWPLHSAENEVGYLAAFVVNSTSQSVELHYIHYKVATILPEEMSNFWDPN